MTRYRAEAYHMDSEELATLVGHFQSQVEARHRCHRHAQEPLEFRAPQAGLWKAQGTEHWYQISRLDDHR